MMPKFYVSPVKASTFQYLVNGALHWIAVHAGWTDFLPPVKRMALNEITVNLNNSGLDDAIKLDGKGTSWNYQKNPENWFTGTVM